MDNKEFLKKCNELKIKQQIEQKKRDLAVIDEFKFNEIEEITFISFKYIELSREEIGIRFQKVKALLEKYKLDVDFDTEGMMSIPYDARFLVELDKIFEIESINLTILMKRK